MTLPCPYKNTRHTERYPIKTITLKMDGGANLGREGHKNNLAGASSSASGEGGVIKEQDRLLPIANVGRIMKQILPPNAKISKEAKETMQECVSEFISFVTGEASDKCQKEKRKTVNGDDICWALGALGFDEYAEALKRTLEAKSDTNASKHEKIVDFRYVNLAFIFR
ncbi:Transcription factor CBF/NF-Y/archaeal histone domain [Dillenia turbinata]|uniref:Transcription factor CBF/NF-Y/archaeal histone domain n=1 Tax=Dillenia turbinata TaxID=194707 RepID=A0AAN8VTU0_9MAGN